MLNAIEDQYIWGMTPDYVLQAANRFNPTIVKTRHYSHCVCNNKLFNVTHQPSTTADRQNGFQFIIHLGKKKKKTHQQNSYNGAAAPRSELHLVYHPILLLSIHFWLRISLHTNKPVIFIPFSSLLFLVFHVELSCQIKSILW